MTKRARKRNLATVALCALMTATGAHASDVDAIEKRLRALENEIAKLRKEARQAKAQAAAATEAAGEAEKASNVANAAHGKVDPNAPPPPPVYVTLGLGKGLVVETEDKNSSIKIGGRILDRRRRNRGRCNGC